MKEEEGRIGDKGGWRREIGENEEEEYRREGVRGDGVERSTGALWFKTDILSFTIPRAVRANERTDEQVAQYLRPGSWLFWAIVKGEKGPVGTVCKTRRLESIHIWKVR